MTLYRYITRRFLMAILKVQVIILGIILLFDTVDLVQRLGATSGADQILELTLVRAPAIVSQTFPLVVLIASLWTFLGLARSSELVVSRASGVSGLKLIALPLFISFVLGLFAFSVVNPIVSATKQREAHIRDALGNSASTRLSLSDQNIWLRQSAVSGQMVVQAARAEPDGTALYDVRIFEFDAQGLVRSRVEASHAALKNGNWVLNNARRWEIQGQPDPLPTELTVLTIPTDLTSAELLDSFALPETIAFWELPAFIARMESSGFSAVKHRVFFQTELARPLIFVAMTLIGAAFSMRPVRFGNVSLMVLGAVLAGFAFYFVLDVAASFGAARQVPILVAAWAPPIAAIMLALTLLLHLEDG